MGNRLPTALAVLLITIPCASSKALAQAATPQIRTADEHKHVRSQVPITEWKTLHAEAVADLASGNVVMSAAPETLVNATNRLLIKHGPKYARMGTLRSGATYRDVLGVSEMELAELGLRVRITVSSSPVHCLVQYRPVVGGGVLDAGLTTVDTELDPRFYVFTCGCQPAVPPQTVDCTSDRKIVFSCKAPAPSPDQNKLRKQEK